MDSSSGDLTPQLMALTGDVMWGRWAAGTSCGQDPAWAWWEKGSGEELLTLQLPHNPGSTQEETPWPPPSELEENPGLMPEKWRQRVAGVARLCPLSSWGRGPPAGGEGLAEGGVRDLFPLCYCS